MTKPRSWMVFLVSMALFSVLAACWLQESRFATLTDADLMPTRVELAEADNGWTALQTAAEHLRWPGDLSRRGRHFALDETWDQERVEVFLEENREARRWLATALARDRIQVPAPQSFHEDYAYFNGWRRLGTLASIRAEDLFRRGQEEPAFAAATEVVRLGHRLQESGGTLMHHLVATTVKREGWERIGRLTARTTLPPDSLREQIQTLTPYGANVAGLAEALKVEYQLGKALLDQLASGQWSGEIDSGLARVAARVGSRPFLSIPRSQARLAELCRAGLADLDRPYVESAVVRLEKWREERSVFELLLSGNPLGEIYVGLVSPSWERVLAVKCHDDIRHRATLLLLAFKAYDTERGRLPDQLAELVPEYLDAVPLDAFDGEPFRYSPKERLLYSVGAERDSLGLRPPGERRRRSDLRFPIEFGNAAQPDPVLLPGSPTSSP